MTKVKLTAELIEAFAGTYLSPRFDQARPTPQFHREAWALYCSPARSAMVIAPRDHAKSTALTFSYILAEVLFQSSDYVILIGSTEEMAQEQLSNIIEELHENEDLAKDFGPFEFETSTKTEIIVRCPGCRFRILARGAEQRIRGRMWKGKRPNLIVCDDMEDDEQVQNRDRRLKFRMWFFRAAKQAMSKSGKIRVHGTVLHEDSLLSRLRTNSAWQHLFYKAHRSFDDFSDILWPERWTEADLRAKRQELIDDHDEGGYSTEMLNDPRDSSETFLKAEDFIPMSPRDAEQARSHSAEGFLKICAAADFAVSKADMANRTSFTIGGVDTEGLMYFCDQRVGRWDTSEWMEEMFRIQREWEPEIFWVEDGVIWLSIRTMLYAEMRRRNLYINVEAVKSVKDKATRGRSLQKRMRAKATRWDTGAEWFPGMKDELLRFTGVATARLDDQFDSASLLSIGFDHFGTPDEEDFIDEEEWDMIREDPRATSGQSSTTGY